MGEVSLRTQGRPCGRPPTAAVLGRHATTATGEPASPSASDDDGFKDRVSANPAVVTTIHSPFDLPMRVSGTKRYMLHCHILEHGDNDMMRPYEVLGERWVLPTGKKGSWP